MSLDPIDKLSIDSFHVDHMFLAVDAKSREVNADEHLGLGDEIPEPPLDRGWAQGPRVVHEGQCTECSQVRHTLDKDVLGGEVEHGGVRVCAGGQLQPLKVLVS
jgi:hypothetical protein